MEKNRTVQLVAILALVVGVIGLSIGFAAFSNTLKIQSGAEVTPSKDTLNVDGYQIVISHITDGCLCQYVKEVELISPNVDEDEVPTKPAPKKKNKAKPITQEEFLED